MDLNKLIVFLIIVPILLVFYTLFVMWLWNYIMTFLFHLPEIDFWHAMGLTVLAKLLFSNLGAIGK
jgi:ABC-type sulfate transport system permease subunit